MTGVYEYFPTPVDYQLLPTGRNRSQVVETLVDPRCPACGVDWRPAGSHRVGAVGGQREFRCGTCEVWFRGRKVDEHGVEVPSWGWGETRRRRQASSQ